MSSKIPDLAIKELKTLISVARLEHKDCLSRPDLERRAGEAVARTSAMVASLDLSQLKTASEVFGAARRAQASGSEPDVRAALENAYARGSELLAQGIRFSLIAQLIKIQWAKAGFVAGAGPSELGLPQGGVIGGADDDTLFGLLDAREIYVRAREAARARRPDDWLDEPSVAAACAGVEAAQAKLGLTRETMGAVADQVEGRDIYGNRLWHSRLGRKRSDSKY